MGIISAPTGLLCRFSEHILKQSLAQSLEPKQGLCEFPFPHREVGDFSAFRFSAFHP